MSRKDVVDPAPKRRKLSDGSATQDGSTGVSKNIVPSTRSQARNPKTGSGSNGTTTSLNPSISSQVKDLVSELTPRAGTRYQETVALAERVVEELRKLPAEGPFTLQEAIEYSMKNGRVAIPFPSPRPAKDSQLKYSSDTPASVSLLSSSTLSLAHQASEAFEIDVQMPASLFQEKDYLNLRAFYKRAFYVSRVASMLKAKFAAELDINFHLKDDIALMPALIMTSVSGSKVQRFPIEVNVSFPSDVFPAAKTTIEKNCVRFKSTSASEVLPPTPFYNSCLQYASSAASRKALIATAEARSSAFDASVRLGTQWLTMRGLSSFISGGGFGWEEWAYLCALLLHTGGPRGQPLFSDRYSALQLFKAVLQTLASRDMFDPWILRGAISAEMGEIPIIYDVEVGFNVLYKMSSASYEALRGYAKESLIQINRKDNDSFDQTFRVMISIPILEYDEVYSVQGSGGMGESAMQMQYIDSIYGVLKRGLDDRVRYIALRSEASSAWEISAQSERRRPGFKISLLLEAKQVSRLVDHGPSAEDQDEASEFQQFWGDKAELRRFKDGSISESLVWTSSEPVTYQILRHLLHRHLSIEPGHVKPNSIEFEQELSAPSMAAKQYFGAIDQTFQKLSTSLLALSDLPLPVRSVAPASEALRSSALATPLGSVATGPFDVLIEFDSSGRWPDSLPAVQHTKIAFLVKLGDVITASNPSLSARVGLENSDGAISGYLNTSFLDITYPSPEPGLGSIVFRLRIVHERELHLLQNEMSDRSLSPLSRESVSLAVATYKRDFLAVSRHTTALKVLMTQFPALSPTVRLLKQWSCAHLLAQHIPGELLELIACYVFLQPSPWTTPSSASTAFVRCLSLLARWDWVSVPLVIDVSPGQDMTKHQETEIRTRFEAWRKLDPVMNQVSWFVGSSLDETGVVWTTKSRMEKVVAARAQAVAKACLDVLTTQNYNLSDDTAHSLFAPPLGDYDFLITLNNKVLARKHRRASSDEKYRNLVVESENDISTVGFDAVEDLLRDLQQAFGHIALFMYGASKNGDNIIAGLWRPSVQGVKDWRVRLGWSTTPLSSELAGVEADKETCSLNATGVLSEVGVIGKGLIKDIKLQRHV